MIAAMGLGMSANAQNFAIKAYDNIALGKPLHVTNQYPGQSAKCSANSFGLDFGWTFWRHGNNSLEANIGVGYSFLGATFGFGDLDYNYAAPATADDDLNEYQRYYEIRDLKQKSTVGYVQVPIYLDYEYRCARWLGVYAEAGVNLGFRVFNSTGSTTGTATSWGVFPIYDDLEIREDYLDHFGTRSLVNATRQKTETKDFSCHIMCGAGFEFFPYQPVSFVVGVRYEAGMTQLFKGGLKDAGSSYTEATAPVTYTAWEKNGNNYEWVGQTEVKSLADYVKKSRFSPLNLHVGVNIRF